MHRRRLLMKISRSLATCAVFFLWAPLLVCAQGTKAPEAPDNATAETPMPVKLQIVLSEYDGTKKIANLPYTMPLIVTGKPSGAYSTLRIGVNARVAHADDEKYQVDLKVDRSSLYTTARGQDGKAAEKEWSGGEAPPTTEPIVRQSRGDVGMILREGQSTEGTVATDPLTGHVFKVEVTLNVVK